MFQPFFWLNLVFLGNQILDPVTNKRGSVKSWLFQINTCDTLCVECKNMATERLLPCCLAIEVMFKVQSFSTKRKVWISWWNIWYLSLLEKKPGQLQHFYHPNFMTMATDISLLKAQPFAACRQKTSLLCYISESPRIYALGFTDWFRILNLKVKKVAWIFSVTSHFWALQTQIQCLHFT